MRPEVKKAVAVPIVGYFEPQIPDVEIAPSTEVRAGESYVVEFRRHEGAIGSVLSRGRVTPTPVTAITTANPASVKMS